MKLRLPAPGLGLSCLVSALAVCLLVGPGVLLHPGRSAVGSNPASDFQIMTWSLEWWPWAVRHWADPLHTNLLWPPGGFSTLWMTTIPVPALLALPLTLTAGPLVAYNALMLLAVPLATAAAYLLCRELGARPGASVVGGVVFGLSPYMLGHTLSQHLDLTFVFPVPLLALLVVRRARGRLSAGRFVAGFAALLLLLLGSSLELFVDFTLVAAIGVAVALLAGGSRRRASARIALQLGLAFAACLPVLVPIAVLGLSGSHGALRNAPTNYATDLLNLVVPTPTLLAGRAHAARAVSRHFVGNVGEQDGYLGVPLLVVVLLALRSEWRRGASLAGPLLAATLLLSFGPLLTVGGRPLLGLPFATARLPILANALPARMSLFVALGAASLCALWLSRPGRSRLRLCVGALVLVSLLPNFSPARRLPAAWSVSDAFGWSTPRVPRGFVGERSWQRVVPYGSTVLVLPTGDHTAASYWQVESGMRFALAVPATPFVPPPLAASPVVLGLVDDDLPVLAGTALGAARLRAFLIRDRIGAVVVTPRAARRWDPVVARATSTRPVVLAQARVYRVPPGLEPLPAFGSLVVARAPLGAARAAAWVRFDGHVGQVRARAGAQAPVTLSSPTGDADATAAAVNAHGRAAAAFTEWRDQTALLRVATRAGGGWQVSTLERSKEPIWSPRVVVTADGTTVATWIDNTGPTRAVRVAARPPGGLWQRPATLENADGLGTVVLGAGRGDLVVAAWHDGAARESRVRVATYAHGRWTPVVTLARSLSRAAAVTVSGADAQIVSWRLIESAGRQPRFTARRRAGGWEPSPPA